MSNNTNAKEMIKSFLSSILPKTIDNVNHNTPAAGIMYLASIIGVNSTEIIIPKAIVPR